MKAPPAVRVEDWWTPDPRTGVYVPEHYHGCVTTAPREPRKNETELGQNQGPWFDNMEELPDMERHKKI